MRPSGQFFGIGHEVEADARLASRQGDGTDDKRDHEGEQADHHEFDHSLDAPAQAHAAYAETEDHRRAHPEAGSRRIADQAAEKAAHLIGGQAGKIALAHGPTVGQHPARHRGVKHHEQVTSDKAEGAEHMPARALGLQLVQGRAQIALRRAANGELHDQDGDADRQQEADIDEHEQRAAVGACDIGETPDVPKSDGAARREKKKTDAAAELFSLLVLTHAFLNPLCPAGTSVFTCPLVYGNLPHLAAGTTEGGGRNAPVGRNSVAPPLLQKMEEARKGQAVRDIRFSDVS